MADSSLVVESGQAKHCQAQLTRLQMALGLKEEVEHDGKASNAIVAGGPTEHHFLRSREPQLRAESPCGRVRCTNGLHLQRRRYAHESRACGQI